MTLYPRGPRLMVRCFLMCYECETEVLLVQDFMYAGHEVPYKPLPEGWHIVDEYVFCPAHTITVDAQEVT